jgi:hypothetical protein
VRTRELAKIGLMFCIAFGAFSSQKASFSQTPEEQRAWGQKRYAYIPKLTAQQAYVLFEAGKLILVDTGEAYKFKYSHAWGAVSIPEENADKLTLRLPKETLIATYCR